MPQDWDGKTIEFENAKAGIACIETSFATIHHLLPKLTEQRIAELFSINARKVFSLSPASIEEGSTAELTLFSRKEITTISKNDSKSKSANSPFWDIKLTGKILGTVSKGTVHTNK